MLPFWWARCCAGNNLKSRPSWKVSWTISLLPWTEVTIWTLTLCSKHHPTFFLFTASQKRPVSGKFITLFMHALKLAHMCSRCFRFVQTLSFHGRWTKDYVLWSQTYNLLFFLSVSVLVEAQDGLVQEGRLPPPLPPRQPSVVREDNMLLIPQRQVGEEDLNILTTHRT